MPLVVDASALASIIFGEPEGPDMARYLDEETLIAPALLDYEIANIGLKKIHRQPDRMPEILAALDQAGGLNIERVPVPPLGLLALASSTGLTAYDAAYLWVAISRDAELVTLDHQLARANEALRENG